MHFMLWAVKIDFFFVLFNNYHFRVVVSFNEVVDHLCCLNCLLVAAWLVGFWGFFSKKIEKKVITKF